MNTPILWGVCVLYYQLEAQGTNNQIWKDLGAMVALKTLQGTSLYLWAFTFLFKVVWKDLETLVPEALNSLCVLISEAVEKWDLNAIVKGQCELIPFLCSNTEFVQHSYFRCAEKTRGAGMTARSQRNPDY